jgi:hypothetical protein
MRAGFNSSRGGGASATPIVLNLGLHAGPCIAVTRGDVLDCFGATANLAARLERACRGGKVIVSDAVAKDVETAATLADRTRLEGTATLRGVSARSQSATSLTASGPVDRVTKDARLSTGHRVCLWAADGCSIATGPRFAHSGRLESTLTGHSRSRWGRFLQFEIVTCSPHNCALASMSPTKANAAAISGNSGVGAKPSSAGPIAACASARRPIDR